MHAEPNDAYFARRAAQHRLLATAVRHERARTVHRQLAAAYERHAVRAILDRDLG